MQRYRFYREHKYVLHQLGEVQQKIARCDFTKKDEVDSVEQEFLNLKSMLHFHAEHENKSIHELLRIKGSRIHESCEREHGEQEALLAQIQFQFDLIRTLDDLQTRMDHGQELYLLYRTFHAEMLIHLNDEETLIMPELQRLCTDEELGSVDAKTYELMGAEDMIQMLEVLSPHMNASDYDFFLEDIRRTQPEKYEIVARSFARA